MQFLLRRQSRFFPTPQHAPVKPWLSKKTRQQNTLLALLLCFSSFACFYNIAAYAESTNYSWSSVPIGGGGYLTGLMFHPTEKDLFYSRTDVGGAYRWQAETQSWLPLLDHIGRDTPDDLGILSIALNPKTTSEVYLLAGMYFQDWAAKGALLRSEDYGKTWQRFALPIWVGGNENGRGAGERLVLNPHNTDHLMIASNKEGLWQSFDRGESWQKVNGLSEQALNFALFAGKAPNKTKIYVSAANKKGSLYVSSDRGKSWQLIAGQPTDQYFRRAVAINDDLYLTSVDADGPVGVTKGGVWHYNSTTEKWREISPDKGQGGYSGIDVDINQPSRIVVSTFNRWYPSNEVFISEDYGLSWRATLADAEFDYTTAPYTRSAKPHWLTDIRFNPHAPQEVWTVTGYGVLSNRNIDLTTNKKDANLKPKWQVDNLGMEETVILEMISLKQGPPLMSVMGDIDGFTHYNFDKSPENGRFSPERSSNNSLAFAYNKPNIMARTIERGEEIHGAASKDGGKTWVYFENEPNVGALNDPELKGKDPHAGQVAFTADGTTLLWTPKEMPMFYTQDQGKTWQASQGLPKGLKPVTCSVDNQVVFAHDIGEGRLYRSQDQGKTFTALNYEFHKLPYWQAGDADLKTVPDHKGHLYLTSGKNLYRSTNAGETFEIVKSKNQSILGAYEVTFGIPKTEKDYPVIFLWGKIDDQDGIYRSTDQAQTWLRINDDQHQYGMLRTIVGDMQKFGRVYLGTSGRGIIVGEPES